MRNTAAKLSYKAFIKKSPGKTKRSTAKNSVISPDFLVWRFCRKAQFPHSFRRLARNYAETVPFRKIRAKSKPKVNVQLRLIASYFKSLVGLRLLLIAYLSQWKTGILLKMDIMKIILWTLVNLEI